MAYLTKTVNPDDVLDLLKKNHSLEPGAPKGRVAIDLEEMEGGRQKAAITLTYVLSREEVDQLLK